MKIITPVILGVGLLLTSSGLRAQSLLLHYTFDNAISGPAGISDASGNKRNARFGGTGSNGPAGSGVSGAPHDRAFENKSITMGEESTTGGIVVYSGKGFGAHESFTLTLWVKTSGPQTLAPGTRLIQTNSTNNGQRLYLGVNGAGNLSLSDLTGGELIEVDSSDGVLSASNEWLFIAVVYDGTKPKDNFTLYAGKKDTPAAALRVITRNARSNAWDFGSGNISLYFGGYYSEVSSKYQGGLAGYLDDIRLYGAATGTAGALDSAALNLIRLAEAKGQAPAPIPRKP